VLMVLVNLKAADGVASYAMNYFRKLEHEKIHMDFVIYSDEMLVEKYKQEIEAAGGNVFVLPRFSDVLKHYQVCKEIIEQGNYDIIHDNSLIITLPLMAVAKYAGVPVRIVHSHNSKLGETKVKEIRNRVFLPFLLHMANQYTACSKLAGAAMFGNEKFIVVPNVIDGKKYKFSEVKRNHIRECLNVKDKYLIITVGRLAKQKNPFFAMDVFKQVVEVNYNAEYWWVGDGPLQQQVCEYAEKIGISSKVKFLGSRTDVDELYQAADCFFLPSNFEGLPVTCIEAQANGLPCIVSDTISKEIVYTDLVEFVEIDSLEKWKKALLAVNLSKRTRDEYFKLYLQSAFSINAGGVFLEKMYYGFLKK